MKKFKALLMPGIYHTFTIRSIPAKVFEGISAPNGLDAWWTKNSQGNPEIGSIYQLDFGPGYVWKAVVTKSIADKEFELRMTDADADWIDTKIGFSLSDKNNTTQVNFYHTGWEENTEHYRFSSYCWAMYLRILKRSLELGENVPFEKRLSV